MRKEKGQLPAKKKGQGTKKKNEGGTWWWGTLYADS